MLSSDIIIKGAREHNLRDIDLVLPRNKLICLTGVSGSGKSSLAFDTLYAEGQRRYVESLSSYARQFLGQMPKPDVELISGLSPSISISQKSAGNNPRSTVGTITEIYDYLRVLLARVGTPHCPSCGGLIAAQSREQIIEQILSMPEGTKLLILAPLIRGQKGEYRDLCDDLRKQGFSRARVDGTVVALSDDLQLDRHMRHDIEVVIDRLAIRGGIRPRLAEAVDTALKIGRGNLIAQTAAGDTGPESAASTAKSKGKRRSAAGDLPQDHLFSVDNACADCRLSFDAPSPQLFSFNSPQGMCLECDGLGQAYTFDGDLLVPDDSLSVKQGCIAPLGVWKQIGRYRRATYEGVASTVDRLHQLPEGTMLETPWRLLSKPLQDAWLWGTGNENITVTWRGGATPIKFGTKFEGIVPQLLARYRSARSPILIAELENFMRTMACPECGGQRLNRQARFVRLTTAHPNFDPPAKSLPEICRLSIADAQLFFAELRLTPTQQIVATEAIKEIRGRLGFLANVGLDYLTLERTAPTLSGGESQRIRLAGQVGCGLVGVLYILDEPSIGLHPRDNDRLLSTLTQLRDVGNTVVVVEHDEDTMRHADHIIDFGPGPGVRGGHVVAAGSLGDIQRAEQSVTGQFLAGKRQIVVPAARRAGSGQSLNVIQAAHNNLQGVDIRIPLGKLVCITGVSGSGKSSLVNDILIEALRRDLNGGEGQPGAHERIEGLEHLDKMIAIDQTPIGRTPRSNPSTYIKVFDDIRRLFTQLPESKQRGYKPGRFSFNVEGGRCEACEGNGSNKLEMDFLADIWVVCPVCEGHRFNRETLGAKYKNASIADVLEMDVQQALAHFVNIPPIQHKLQTLHDVGLDYLKLGQPSPTLSGGEAQRIKLARELVKKSTGRTLYLLDEPTTGLHFADIHLLLDVLHGFVDAGNTVLVVEHNLDVIKTADWIIDLGPEGGAGGGRLVAEGTPEQLIEVETSYTGKALAGVLRPERRAAKTKPAPKSKANGKAGSLASHIVVRGARQHNLKDVDVKIPREQMSVFCGPSGSGKTSLAMDTIYAEGQRRYVESLSSYARQFVSQMQKPQLEHIEGLSPAIAIEQQNLGSTPRSTVGTSTEIYDYLRVLLARLGAPYCPDCDRPIGTQTVDQVVEKIMSLSGSRIYMLAPVQIDVGQKYETLWDDLRRSGFARIRVDGVTHSLDQPPEIDRRRRHHVAVLIDRANVRADARSRIAESAEAALALGKGIMQVAMEQPNRDERQWEVRSYNQQLACDQCGRSFERLTPHNFSFNSQLGWCPECEGLGTQTGAHPAALLDNPQASLADGALLLWPNLNQAMSRQMLNVFSNDTGIPLDVPFERLSARQRRVIFHGTGDRWFTVRCGKRPAKQDQPWFRFQFKGMYPALEESARLTPNMRFRLNYLVGEIECAACGGSRLRDDAAAVRCKGQTMDDLCRMPLRELQRTIEHWKLDAREKKIAGELLREIKSRVKFLNDVGLEYLTLSRTGASLSGGEAQRIRLASQLGSGLCGVLYVLDEPTVGLHPRDNLRLLKALHGLRDLGNTLLIVEHDREVIAGSDALFDFGPQAGKNGGQVVASGTPLEIQKRAKSVTGPYLSGKKSIPIPANRRDVDPRNRMLVVRGARHNNLKNIDVTIPLERFVAVTGPSGSGKSSLVDDILHSALAARLHRAATVAGAHDRIEGVEFINKVIRVDQQPLGNSPTSNPATYTKAFDVIRELFAQLSESKLRGYTPRRFSFNVPGGRCEACEGNGQLRIEMHFLPDVWVECETCSGKRYNQETLEVRYHGKSIADVLDMTCDEAADLFENIPKIRRIIETLQSVGLGYLALGQPAPTLSGGEAQRVKLAAELARPDTGQTLYLLDEPTTGLHFDDLAKLLDVLQRLVDLGNSVVVIEHNLDVIKSADWVIDMGPDAGQMGGTIVAEGTPEHIAGTTDPPRGRRKPAKKNEAAASATGMALAPILSASPRVPRIVFNPQAIESARTGDLEIKDVGRETRMPWEVNGRGWHTKDRVGRRGEPCRWDGRILDEVERRIQATGKFAPTNWNSRTIVEITGPTKSDGWFMHAITGEAWLLKLKFRVAKGTFQRDALQKRLPLEPLNAMDHLPIYGNEPRVNCKVLRGPWQEIELRLHAWQEANQPEFWSILDESVAGFERMLARVNENPEQVMPWKKLGQRWHYSRKGFPPGKPIVWEQKVLEDICELLNETAGEGQFLWNNQQVVHLYVKEQKEPWASIWTKRPQELSLVLTGPKGAATLGRVAELGHDRELDASHRDRDVVKIVFRDCEDIRQGDLLKFLSEHRNSLGA